MTTSRPSMALSAAFILLSILSASYIGATGTADYQPSPQQPTGELPDDPFVDTLSQYGSYSDHIGIIGIGNISMPVADCPEYPKPRSISTDERLTILTNEGWKPNLAKQIVPTDEDRVQVTLRNIKWSDGTPFEAADVAFSVSTASSHREVSSPFFWHYRNDSYHYIGPTVTELDRHTAELVFDSQNPLPFEQQLHEIRLFPKKRFSEGTKLNESTLTCLKIGNSGFKGWPTVGAYELIDVDIEEKTIRFGRNAHYSKVDNKDQRQPYYNEAIYALAHIDSPYVITDDAIIEEISRALDAVQRVTERPVDVIELPGSLLRAMRAIKAKAEEDDLSFEVDRLRSDARGSAAAYVFNYRHGELGRLFRDRGFREATSLAIDRTFIADDVFMRDVTGVEPSVAIVGPIWTGYEVHSAPTYDVTDAASRLRDAKDRVRFEGDRVVVNVLVYKNDSLVIDAMNVVVEAWQQVGIDANVRMVTFGEIYHLENYDGEVREEFEIIARSFYLPERTAWESKPGWMIPPYRNGDVDGTIDDIVNEIECDDGGFCEELRALLESLNDWHDFGRYDRGRQFLSEEYRQHVTNVLSVHDRNMFAVGIVSDLPIMTFFLSHVRRCDGDVESRQTGEYDYRRGGDRYCPI